MTGKTFRPSTDAAEMGKPEAGFRYSIVEVWEGRETDRLCTDDLDEVARVTRAMVDNGYGVVVSQRFPTVPTPPSWLDHATKSEERPTVCKCGQPIHAGSVWIQP